MNSKACLGWDASIEARSQATREVEQRYGFAQDFVVEVRFD